MADAPRSPQASPAGWNLVASAYAAEVVPVFEGFADDAMELAELAPGERVVDVASGPGTLALRAAARGAQVTAVDFAESMIDELRSRARARDLRVDARVGDGMELGFADRSFDAAFSLFGVIFYPDRARGLSEMLRVLAPGGRAVITTWVPAERLRVLSAFFDALRASLPSPPSGGGQAIPLSDEASIVSEMSAVGFADVAVRQSTRAYDVPSSRDFVDAQRRSSAPYALIGQSLGPEAFERLHQQVCERFVRAVGEGPLRLEMTALIARGRRPGE